MDEDQKQSLTGARIASGGVIAMVLSILGCILLVLLSPAIGQPARLIILAVMLLLALIGAVLSFMAALKPKHRVIGIITLLLCLSFITLWSLTLIGPAIEAPDQSAE
jgi:hypothetical protein